MARSYSDPVLAFASIIGVLFILPTWTICFFRVLQGDALEIFQLGTVITSKTALGATNLEVLISQTLYLVILLGGFVARYLRRRAEREFLDDHDWTKGRSMSEILKARRLGHITHIDDD